MDLDQWARLIATIAGLAGVLGTLVAAYGIWRTRRLSEPDTDPPVYPTVFFPASGATSLNSFTQYLTQEGNTLLFYCTAEEEQQLARWWEGVQARRNQEAVEEGLRANAPAVQAAAQQVVDATLIAVSDYWGGPTLAEEDALVSWERKRRAQQIFDTTVYPRETVGPSPYFGPGTYSDRDTLLGCPKCEQPWALCSCLVESGEPPIKPDIFALTYAPVGDADPHPDTLTGILQAAVQTQSGRCLTCNEYPALYCGSDCASKGR